MHLGNVKREDMLKHVKKKDGTRLLLHTIDDVIAKKKGNPEWMGEDSIAGGRPKELSPKECQEVVRLVFRERGKAKVTIAYCKKKLPFLRRVCDSTVADALHDAGLKWLTRRLKWIVPALHKEQRIAFARFILSKHQSTLDRFAYTDGVAIYLARTYDEKDQKGRLALGKYVWRMANGSDGLFEDNIGPSMYAKAQGLPVKLWGFLANGKLFYWVLPVDPDPEKKTTHMNGERYQHLVNTKFPVWRQEAFGDDEPCHIVQDHERCLWTKASLDALKKAKCPVIVQFPKSSPDLNVIENTWKLLRQRLAETEPTHLEKRPDFLDRLRRAVAWLNENKAEEMLYNCTNQKERARDVLTAEPPGSKTKW